MPECDNWREIDPDEFECGSFRVWVKDWLLLAAGNFDRGEYNAMTVGWGFFGSLWRLPAVMVMVRPQRRTLEFLERHDTFTLTAYDAAYRDGLAEVGRVSGRDVPDKLNRNGFTAMRAEQVDAPTFAEAELSIECRKLYASQLNGKNFIDKSFIESMYPERDYHVCFFGEVVRIAGTEKYMNADAILERYGR